MTLLPLFGRYFHFKFRFFFKMSVFLKFPTIHIIIAQTTYFENIQYCKIYFHYGLGLAKTSYNDSASFFWEIFPFQISISFQKCSFLSNFSNCRIILAQTTYFENIKYYKIYFHYGLGLAKTSYNDSASFRILIFFKKVHFSQVFKLLHNYSPKYLFRKQSIL